MYEGDYECYCLVNFQRQLLQAQEAIDDQRRRLQSHASPGGAPSSDGKKLDSEVHPLLRLPLRNLDREDESCFLHSVCFDKCEYRLHVISKFGDFGQRQGITTEEGQRSTLLPYEGELQQDV
ncbi:hypothetical protein MRX96_025030 [Rhipicephalus microplus]